MMASPDVENRSTPELPDYAMATEYRFSLIPWDHPDSSTWSLTVKWRGSDRWCVSDVAGSCYDADGDRDYEPIPSSRTEEWLERHRFDLPTALALAERLLPSLRWNGLTSADVLEIHRQKEAT